MKAKISLLVLAAFVIVSLAFTIIPANEKNTNSVTEEWFYYKDLTGNHDINDPFNYEPAGEVPTCNSGDNRCAVYAEPLTLTPQYPDMSTVGGGDIRNKP